MDFILAIETIGQYEEVQKATLGGFLIYLAIQAAMAYGAYLLLKPKKPKTILDDSEIDPSIRGSICPVLLGRRVVTPIVGWVGNSVVQSVRIPDSDGQHKPWYNQSGMHILSLGLGEELYTIYERGKKIWSTTLDSTTHPSGTPIVTGVGTMRIYWGEANQAVDAVLNSYTGYDLAYRNIMYIVWDWKVLGDQKVWPVLEYEIKVVPQFTTLFSKPVWISSETAFSSHTVNVTSGLPTEMFNDFRNNFSTMPHFTTTDSTITAAAAGYKISITSGPDTFESHIQHIEASVVAGSTWDIQTVDRVPSAFYGSTGLTLDIIQYAQEGLNVAAIIYQFLFSVFPYGLGYDTADYNLTDLEAVFDFFDGGATYQLPASVYLKDQKSIQDGLAMILQDSGINLGWDITTAQYRFTVAKATDTPTEIPYEDYSFPKNKDFIEKGYSVLEPQHRYYTFRDSQRKFKQSTTMITDDSSAQYAKLPNAKAVALYTITSLDIAAVFAVRKDREFYSRAGLKPNLTFNQGGILPGGLYSFEGITGSFRLTKKELNPDKAQFKCDFVQDIYSVAAEAMVVAPYGSTASDGINIAVPDIVFGIFETNKFFNPNEDGFYFIRIRGSKNSSSTSVNISADDTSYFSKALTTEFFTGGILVDALVADTATTIATGPAVTFLGLDAGTVRDLSADDYNWKAGTQICIINNEIFFLQNITTTGNDNEYTLDGLIRGRQGTNFGAHSIDDEVFIGQVADMLYIQDVSLLAGIALYVKSVPYTDEGSIDIDDVTPVSITYNGGGHKPLPCINLNTENGSLAWLVGDPVAMEWGYRNIAGNAGAGLGAADEAYSAPTFEGYFKIEFLSGSTVMRTVDVFTNSYSYPNATLVSDFSGEPATVNVKVYNVNGGHQSDELEVTVTKE